MTLKQASAVLGVRLAEGGQAMSANGDGSVLCVFCRQQRWQAAELSRVVFNLKSEIIAVERERVTLVSAIKRVFVMEIILHVSKCLCSFVDQAV
jgi:hypothetical protein